MLQLNKKGVESILSLTENEIFVHSGETYISVIPFYKKNKKLWDVSVDGQDTFTGGLSDVLKFLDNYNNSEIFLGKRVKND